MRLIAHTLAVLAVFGATAEASAQSLTFRPQRIVIDARTATSSLSLTNTGKEAASFRVELVDMIYQDDGKVVPVARAPAGHPTAKELIRFSPSQIRLEPGETQTVRILVKPQSTEIAQGEYRVHAVIRQLPNVSGVTEPARASTVAAGVIGIEQAVAIPVIVRRGETSATGSIVSIKIVDGKSAQLDMVLGRSGTRSIYSNLVIKDRSGTVVSEIKGVAVPVPNMTRRFFFPLNDKTSPAALRGGGFTIEMIDHDNAQAVLDSKPIR